MRFSGGSLCPALCVFLLGEMELHILSDLHLEFAPLDPPETDADMVILAGDIHTGLKGVAWAREKFPNNPVVYVPGNHEYYGEALPKHTAKLREAAAGSHVHVLENDSLIIDNIVFLGCTLWTDFELLGDPRVSGSAATERMSDYKRIRVSPQYRRLRSIDTVGLHHVSLRWLRAGLEKHRGEKSVIVTHHAPSRKSLPARHLESIYAAAYASDLDSVVEQSGAML